MRIIKLNHMGQEKVEPEGLNVASLMSSEDLDTTSFISRIVHEDQI